MNGEYIRKMAPEQFHEAASPYYSETLKEKVTDTFRLSRLLQPRTEAFSDIPAMVDFFESLPDYDISLYEHKKMKTDAAVSLTALKAALPVLEKAETWENDALYAALTGLAGEMGMKNSQILWPVRTALSGKAATPGGATELAELLGKGESVRRILKGIEKLS